MIFLGYFLMYVVRYNLSVHIIDMAKINAREVLRDKENGNMTYYKNILHLRTRDVIGIISWDDMQMARLFAAYHIGYCICFPLFHSYGDRLGPTWIVGISGMLSGVLNCLTPASAIFGSYFWVLFLVRIIIGFCAGAMQPSMVQVLKHWVPPMERNHFMWVYCGITTGTFSTLIFCAVIQYYSRWPVGFYIAGGLQVLWAVSWVTIVTDQPNKHSCISREELAYLNDTIGTFFTIKSMNANAPWKMILKSMPFWSVCILHFGYAWMITSLALHGPLYYASVIDYTIYNASILTAIPFLLRLILGTIVIQIFHSYVHSSKVERIKHFRKYFVVVSHIIPGILVCSCWFSNVVPGPILLSLAVALTAAGMDMTMEMCYKLSPNYFNSIYTVIKIIGNTPGIIVSFCVGAVTEKWENSPDVWKHVWCFHAAVLFFSGVIFLVWGDTDVQPWNTSSNWPHRQKKERYFNRPSIMSRITEVDEDAASTSHIALSNKLKTSFFPGSFRSSKSNNERNAVSM